MPAKKRVKNPRHQTRLVGVIMTPKDLRLAKRMLSPPDLFELRLDSLFPANGLEQKGRALAAPLIITARHPIEGGQHNLSTAVRRDLLLRFLPIARYVDVELRSVHTYRTVLEQARRLGVSTIISFHDLGTTPSLGSLRAKAVRAARLRPAIFKVATRTDTTAQLTRLLEFISLAPSSLSISAMGMGRLGAVSRLLLAQCGSALVYTSLKEPQVEGQVPFKWLSTALRQLRFD